MHLSNDNAFSDAGATAVRQIIRARRAREQLLGNDLFADPAWDILLELYACALEQRRVTLSHASSASNVPISTALRWVAKLVNEGLVTRRDDHLDGRRSWLELSAKGRSALDRIVASMPLGGAV
jgi:DNA-binding MarR family transcriptional regulator